MRRTVGQALCFAGVSRVSGLVGRLVSPGLGIVEPVSAVVTRYKVCTVRCAEKL